MRWMLLYVKPRKHKTKKYSFFYPASGGFFLHVNSRMCPVGRFTFGVLMVFNIKSIILRSAFLNGL